MQPAAEALDSTSQTRLENRAIHRMPFGAEVQVDGSVRFALWAPAAESVHLALEQSSELISMQCSDKGWHTLTTSLAQVGSLYRFVLPSGLRVPDPVSRFQPDDVEGPSEVIDPEGYAWQSVAWSCCAWEEAVIYELHVGTFTPEGTFRAAIGKLEQLAALGVTAIEIMSIGDFPGRRNWGYDGVLMYAPDSSYGRPEELKSFVDAAHSRNMMVILDVVYNHFGPEGNYLGQYFPDVMTQNYHTPWGQALNFDSQNGEKTRKFIVHNALYWVEEYQMDGLRLDAVHAIIDSSSTHILDELARTVRMVAKSRPIHLILESDDRVWHHLLQDGIAGPVSSTAQWNHDMQKLVALALTSGRPEQLDYNDTEDLGKALVEGFTSGPHHRNTPGGFETPALSTGSFISFLQTHDVVGNRIRGERITHLVAHNVLRAVASVYLLAPQIPMLFMGEEWGASTPFPFFCDFKGSLADAIRRGRIEQFASADERENPKFMASIPDPLAEETFVAAKLNWDERSERLHGELLDWYTNILAVRRKSVVPMLRRLHAVHGEYDILGPRQIQVRWRMETEELRLEANLSDRSSPLFEAPGDTLVWLEGCESAPSSLDAWSVRWSVSRAV
jgi:malto-oligosyltrehalose trehalohydrolase